MELRLCSLCCYWTQTSPTLHELHFYFVIQSWFYMVFLEIVFRLAHLSMYSCKLFMQFHRYLVSACHTAHYNDLFEIQYSHYIFVLKFNDFSRTLKDPEVAFSRTNSPRKFTAWTVLQQYLISISVITVLF